MSDWEDSAATLCSGVASTPAGLWALLDAAAHGAMALSLVTPLGVGVGLAFAAIDLGEARDELDWCYGDLGDAAAARLGTVRSGDDAAASRAALRRVIDDATQLAERLLDDAHAEAELACLTLVRRRLAMAGTDLTDRP